MEREKTHDHLTVIVNNSLCSSNLRVKIWFFFGNIYSTWRQKHQTLNCEASATGPPPAAEAAVDQLAGLSAKFPVLTRIYNPQLLNSHLPPSPLRPASLAPPQIHALICRQVCVRSTWQGNRDPPACVPTPERVSAAAGECKCKKLWRRKINRKEGDPRGNKMCVRDSEKDIEIRQSLGDTTHTHAYKHTNTHSECGCRFSAGWRTLKEFIKVVSSTHTECVFCGHRRG